MLLQLFRVEHGEPRESRAMVFARIESSVGGLHHEEPRESQLQARSFRRSGRLKPAASDNKAQAQMAAFQKAAQVLSGFVSLQRQGRQAARLHVRSILPTVADEVIDESRNACFRPEADVPNRRGNVWCWW